MKKKTLILFCVLMIGISSPMLAQFGPEPPPADEPDGPESPPPSAPINQFLSVFLVLGVTYAGRKFYLKQNNPNIN